MKAARILVVEDESIVAWHVREALHSLGHEVIAIATTARQAIHLASVQRPDLVLMDICLQGENDGVSAAEYLYLNLNLPVVYLTAHADDQAIARAMKTSPFGYLLKPFKEAELHSAIQVALQRYQLETAIKATQQWYATTLVSIGDAMIATDVDGFITFMNPAAEFLTGWTQEQALGEFAGRVLSLVYEETGGAIDNPILAALCRGDTITLPSRAVLRSRDGTERPVGDSASPIRNRDGEIVGGVMVFQDMSDQRQREFTLDAEKQILETSQSLLTMQLKVRAEQLQFAIAADHLRQRIFQQCSANRADFLQWLVQEIAQTLQAERCWVALYDQAATVATLVAAYDAAHPRSRLQPSIEMAEFPVFYAQLFEQRCWICPPPEIVPPLYATQAALMICPIQDEQGTIGEIGVSTATAWTDYQADVMRQIVSQALRLYQREQHHQIAQAKVRELEQSKLLQNQVMDALSHGLCTPLTNMSLAIHLMQQVVDQAQAPESSNAQVQQLEQYLKILQQEWQAQYRLLTDFLAFQDAPSAPEAALLSQIQIQDWLMSVLDQFAAKTGVAVQLTSAVTLIPEIVVHLPSLEKILDHLLAHLHAANPTCPIHLHTAVSDRTLEISARCCTAEESGAQGPPSTSSLRLALLRRFAIALKAEIQVEQQAGSLVLTLSLPMRAA